MNTQGVWRYDARYNNSVRERWTRHRFSNVSWHKHFCSTESSKKGENAFGQICTHDQRSREIYSREQAELSQNRLDISKRAKTEKRSYGIGKLYFKIVENLLRKYNSIGEEQVVKVRFLFEALDFLSLLTCLNSPMI